MNLLRQSRSENPILRLQVLDIFGQLGLRGRGDQGQQRVVNLRHRGMFAISNQGTGYTFTEHRFVLARAVNFGPNVVFDSLTLGSTGS
jgi:hypothetical protein